MYQLSVSLQCMDFKRFPEQISVLNKYMDRYHIDIFDGNYVPNIVFGPEIIENIETELTLPFDIHLAVNKPDVVIESFLKSKADTICMHIETVNHQFFRISDRIVQVGKKVGVVLNPITGLESLDYIGWVIDRITIMTVDPGFTGQKFIYPMLKKIDKVRSFRENNNLSFQIEVDGAVNRETIPDLFRAGADIYILGTSGLFKIDENLEIACTTIRNFFQNL